VPTDLDIALLAIKASSGETYTHHVVAALRAYVVEHEARTVLLDDMNAILAQGPRDTLTFAVDAEGGIVTTISPGLGHPLSQVAGVRLRPVAPTRSVLELHGLTQADADTTIFVAEMPRATSLTVTIPLADLLDAGRRG